MKHVTVFIVIILLVSSVVLANDKVVTVGCYELPPLLGETMENYGLLANIVSIAFKQVGYEVKLKFYPFIRAMATLDKGEIDAVVGVAFTEERAQKYDFSSILYTTEDGFFYKKGKINYTNIGDLKHFTGGLLKGNVWESILTKEGIKFDGVPTHEQNFQKLFADRIDFVCLSRALGNYLLRTKFPEQMDQIAFGTYTSYKLCVAFLKAREQTNIIEEFEKGLKIIKENGTYDQIMSKLQ